MSQEMTLGSLPNATLEVLRCFHCKGYLSSSPIRLLPNGENICGRCIVVTSKTPVYRLVAFEAVLKHMSFPCVNKKYECPEMLLFDKTREHESKCPHKPIPCPMITTTACAWKGIASQVFHHFKNAHVGFVKEKLEFKLELEKDQDGFFITMENSFPFIVKYNYKTKARVLQYDFRFCGGKNEFEMSWKTQLINSSDSDCSVSMKSNKCLLYDQHFYSMQDAQILNLHKFQESLDNPDSIVVAFKLKFDESNVTIRNDLKVNYEVIEKLKCYKCGYYLVPPLFTYIGKAVCCDCVNTSCKALTNPKILKVVSEALYPCNWEECNFVGNNNIYKHHVANCEFRMYVCIYKGCIISFKLGGAVDHLKTHLKPNTIYMPDQITYSTGFVEKFSSVNILAVKDNRIILLNHKSESQYSDRPQYFELHQARHKLTQLVAFVLFEHKHCKLKSKQYVLTSKEKLQISYDEFPKCFENTFLTVTVELFDE